MIEEIEEARLRVMPDYGCRGAVPVPSDEGGECLCKRLNINYNEPTIRTRRILCRS